MYVFYINGGHVEKRFSREFVNYICGGKIKQDIKADECTRKRLVVRSGYAARKLMAVNNSVFWPDGTRFQCKLLTPRDRSKRLCSSTTTKEDRPASAPIASPRRHRTFRDRCSKYRSPSPALSDDWYNTTAFVDVDLVADDDDNEKISYFDNNEATIDSLHHDLRVLSM
ncbi:agip147 [Agrotis ipsilon multiple nucleopolyhedrovirus]|uniref:Late expression factor-6 n=1 Tax=Agrotis ipsilon multiple nucleopolyhedrovirus TaxID=208013 RepID=B6D661_9ABAC|nr:agip147 [Agrotis ipsilon multiple nucleopolyhedrovirus]ACI28848.1 late expression factor-6 [Agrotis ipsilon multiple nucleopolyhedrovirus]